jgi:hypothetical protein
VSRRAAAAVALIGALTLTGCSQVAALAPVGGNRATEIRFATIDVLLDHDIALMDAPTCAMADDRAVNCTGTTVDGQTVTSTSPAQDQASLEVRVGDEVLYEGTIDAVIETSIRP